MSVHCHCHCQRVKVGLVDGPEQQLDRRILHHSDYHEMTAAKLHLLANRSKIVLIHLTTGTPHSQNWGPFPSLLPAAQRTASLAYI